MKKHEVFNMAEKKPYKCVNCGETSAALYKTYGPSVLKLTKCDKCNGIVDKYIEYDPVIVMIDLVLVSQEAQRHVLYNTEFKTYWKLFVILIMIETYGLWRSDSLFNIVVNTACGIQTNGTTLNITHLPASLKWEAPAWWQRQCSGWEPEERGDERDLFIWEKHFYIQFVSTFAGVAAFIVTVRCAMRLLKPFVSQNTVSFSSLVKAFSLANVSTLLTLPMLVWGAEPEPHTSTRAVHYGLVLVYSGAVYLNTFIVSFSSLVKAFSLANVSTLLTLPMLVWGAEPEPHTSTRAVHYGLVLVYSGAVYLNTFIVLYGCPTVLTAPVLAAGYCAKFLTTFHTTPAIRHVLR